MSGDRELDEQVHIEVMGRSRNCPMDRRGQVGGCQHIRAYSSDIAAAMAVFERMVERIGTGGINLDMEDAHGQGHIYHVWIGDSVGVIGPLPLAICRAALAAVKGDGEGAE